MKRINNRLHEIIFEADTKAGRRFDIALMWAILLSVIIVFLESVPTINEEYGAILRYTEYGLTTLFTIEYILRLISVNKSFKYATSFFGVIDLMSILPTFIELFVPGGMASMRVIRVLRLLRVFRVLHLVGFLKEATILSDALWGARKKMMVFLSSVIALVIIIGTLVYIVEGNEGGFTSIPRSIYWAIATVTTVGYGDIAPVTAIGQVLASIIMLIGYAIIAIPTGIVSAELISGVSPKIVNNTKACAGCCCDMHEDDATFCKKCGDKL